MVRLNEIRSGERAVPLPERADAGLYFIGRIRTPWNDRLACPRQGRSDGPTCRVELFPPWDQGLDHVAEFERLDPTAAADAVTDCIRTPSLRYAIM